MKQELKYCPFCRFTEENCKEFIKRHCLSTTWNDYKPIIVEDVLLGEAIIKCQNCGTVVIFYDSEEKCIKLWNSLPRDN